MRDWPDLDVGLAALGAVEYLKSCFVPGDEVAKDVLKILEVAARRLITKGQQHG